MTWLFILLTMAVIALVAGVVTGRIAGSMEPPASSLPFRGLSPEGVGPGDLEELRFDAALRGYRMDEVDQVIDRLADELRRRDDEIAALRDALAEATRSTSAAAAVPGDPMDPFGPPGPDGVASPYGVFGPAHPSFEPAHPSFDPAHPPYDPARPAPGTGQG